MGASRIRSIVGLVAATVVLGVFTLSPVAAHFTTNTKHLGKHAWQQFIKQKVFTKKQANNRFANKKQLPGYNYDNNGEPNTLIGLTGAGASMTSVTLNAPGAGFASVTARALVFVTHTNGTQDNVICKLSKTSGDVTTPSFGISLVRIPAANPTATSQAQTIEITRVFSVNAGTNTFHLNCYENFGSGGDSIIAPEVVALFVPTRYGTGPAPAFASSGTEAPDHVLEG